MRAFLVALLIATACTPTASEWNGFPVRQIDVGGEALTVAVASTATQQARGLMGVETLDGIDGMLFEFPGVTTTRFWMKDTLIPLDIAFFAGDGTLISVVAMSPCETDSCPTYGSPDPYRWAVEAPAGGPLADLPGEVVLSP